MSKRKLTEGEIIGLTNLALKESYGSNKNAIKLKEVNKPCIDDMNKELTPLEALGEIVEDFVIMREAIDYIDKPSQTTKDFEKKWLEERKEIIEIALKNYEHSQNQRELYFKQAKELKSRELGNQKKLKALEIIKSFVYFDIIEVQGQWYLIQGTSFDKSLKVPITKEQTKLLKEVLL